MATPKKLAPTYARSPRTRNPQISWGSSVAPIRTGAAGSETSQTVNDEWWGDVRVVALHPDVLGRAGVSRRPSSG